MLTLDDQSMWPLEGNQLQPTYAMKSIILGAMLDMRSYAVGELQEPFTFLSFWKW